MATHSGGKTSRRLRNTVVTLASVPEFFLLFNSLVKRNLRAIDGNLLRFIFMHTGLLDIHNKLIVCSKIFRALQSKLGPGHQEVLLVSFVLKKTSNLILRPFHTSNLIYLFD